MSNICLKLPPNEIDATNPWKDDALKTRRVLAQRLTNLIAAQNQPISICIDGAWGSGKTFFVERWEKSLKSSDFKVIHFNAWEDDSFDDPMLALVGQLWRDLGLSKSKTELEGEIKKDIKTILSFVCRVARGAAVHFAERKWESWSGLDKASLEMIVGDDTSDAGSILNRFEEEGRAKTLFRAALSRTVERAAKQSSAGLAKPVVFVVDELDRCRPIFAVQVLERIKHFLSVPHLVFVFCVDKQNLSKSLKAVYGDIEVDNYLYRFFDFVFPLTSIDQHAFCDMLWDRYDISGSLMDHDARCNDERDCFFKKNASFKESFTFLATFHRLTFREIEYVFRSYLLVLRDETTSGRRIQPQLLAAMLLLRLRNRALETRFVNLICQPAEVINYLLPANLEASTAHLPSQLAVSILYAFHPWNKEAEHRRPMDSPATQLIKWANSLQSSPGAPINTLPSIPEFVPKVMRGWGMQNLKSLSDWSSGIDGEMRTAFSNGNPLKSYETLVNLMESPRPSRTEG